MHIRFYPSQYEIFLFTRSPSRVQWTITSGIFLLNRIAPSVLYRSIGTGSKTAGAGKTVGLDHLPFIDSLCGIGRANLYALATVVAGLPVYPNLEDAEILNRPTQKAERAYPHAVGSIMDDRQSENQPHGHEGRLPKFPFEELEGIEIAVDGFTFEIGNPAQNQNHKDKE